MVFDIKNENSIKVYWIYLFNIYYKYYISKFWIYFLAYLWFFINYIMDRGCIFCRYFTSICLFVDLRRVEVFTTISPLSFHLPNQMGDLQVRSLVRRDFLLSAFKRSRRPAARPKINLADKLCFIAMEPKDTQVVLSTLAVLLSASLALTPRMLRPPECPWFLTLIVQQRRRQCIV